MPTKIAVIVLNWQQPSLTIDTIRSLLRINHPHFDFHIFLVDNGSTDNSFSQFKKEFGSQPNITLLQTTTNLMFVAGNNFALNHIDQAKFKYTLLLNNDVILDHRFLQILVDYLRRHSTTAAVAPKIYFAPGYEYHPCPASHRGRIIWSMGGLIDWNNLYATNQFIDQLDRGQFNQVLVDPDYLSGCCLLIKTKLLCSLRLDESYWMYFEDVDLCQKLKRQGWHLAVAPKSVVWHKNSGSAQAGGGALHDYFLTRNRLIFGFRYAHFRTKFALFRQSLGQILSSVTPKWQKTAIIDYYTHRWGRGSWRYVS